MAYTSNFMKAMDGIVTEIQALNLTGLEDNRVVVRRLPHDGEVYYPGITVHPVPEKYQPGTNQRESVGYGCAVTMVVNNDNSAAYLLDQLLYWRECIRKYFVENPTLTSVTTEHICALKVEHGNVIEWDDLIGKNYDVSSLIIRVYILESRT